MDTSNLDIDLDDMDLDDMDFNEAEESTGDGFETLDESGSPELEDEFEMLNPDEINGEMDESEVEELRAISSDNANGFISDTGDIVVMSADDTMDAFDLEYIDINKIAVVKRIRQSQNVDSLTRSIKSTGLLTPIVVATTQTDGIYVLLDGFRRILACARAGKRMIPCNINKKVSTPEIPILEAMYNHSKKYSIKEQIDYIDYLEKERGIMSASMIEYLLQMNSGDYTKLKDILTDNDDDIVTKMLDGVYTIEMAFKKLEQRRKKESMEEKENRKSALVYGNEEESGIYQVAGAGEEGEEGAELTDEEIAALAINASDLDNVDNESIEDLMEEGNSIQGFQPHKQDPKYRERLDPALRKSVLAKFDNECQICKQIKGQEYVECIDIHHIQEVYLGGNDDIENLIPACTCCHKLIHLYGRGELYIRPMEELSTEEQAKFKRVMKLGNIIRKGMALKGMKKDQLKKLDNCDTIGRTKPGTGQVAG